MKFDFHSDEFSRYYSQEAVNPDSLGLRKCRRMPSKEATWRCCCPFHNDSNPSATFDGYRQTLRCYTCGKNFSVAEIVEVTGGVIEFEDYTSVEVSDVMEFHHYLYNKSAVGDFYLAARGIPDELVKEFRLKADDDSIIIPLFDSNGLICGVQKRFKDPLVQPKYLTLGGKPIIYPLHKLAEENQQPTVFVEGVFGVLNARKFGINAYAMFGTSNLTQPDLCAIFNTCVHPIVMMDDDEAGQKAVQDFLKIKAPHVSVVANADPDKLTEEQWKEKLNDAIFGI